MRYILFKPSRQTLFKIGLVLIFFLILFFIGLYIGGPPPIPKEQQTQFYHASGEVLLDDETKKNQGWTPIEHISPFVIQATIAIEDQHFYDHHGFDMKRIAMAALKNIKSGSLKEGASTITQQYARNLYLSHEKTWTRKLKEALYAARLEMFYSKKEILEGYLNTIYYGAGAYGIEEASHVYFHKQAKELTLAEAAVLAGIPKGPQYFSPFQNKEKAKKRQELILQVMVEEGMISKQTFEQAKKTVLSYAKPRPDVASTNSYMQETALQEAATLLEMDREAIQQSGYHIYTTFDKDTQVQLEETIQHSIKKSSEIEVGALTLDPETGAIRALVGGRDFQKSPFNRAVQSKRMTGSTFKPFLYYAALENGFKPNTTLISKPTSFQLANQKEYTPRNYNGYYENGPITLAQALALSDNIYAVKTHLFIGMDQLVDTAKTFGITADLPRVPSLALGAASVSVQEMVVSYGRIANGGKAIQGYTIERIVDKNGRLIFTRKKENRQVLDKEKVFILTELLTGMFDESLNGYMAVTGSPILDIISRPYAGKSGSTKSDSWMIGFSPHLVTGVWTGFDDNRPIEKTDEKQYAKHIWATFMEKAHQDLPIQPFQPPKGVIGVPIDPQTGKRATPNCPINRVMYFEAGTEPTSYCTAHPIQQKKQHESNETDKGILQKWLDWFFS